MTPAELLIDHCLGPARSQCIYLFTRLGLAELLFAGPCKCTVLAEAVNVQHDPLYRMLRALSTMEVVKEQEPGFFALGPLGKPLVANAPNSVKAHVLHMNEEMYVAWGHAHYSLETGQSAFNFVHGQKYFNWLATHPDKERTAHRAMNDTQRLINETVVNAYDFSQVQTVCDVGGGHGALLSALLTHHPQLYGIFFDQKSACDLAQSGVGGPLPRCEFVAGDFFIKVPAEADVYLLKLVLHDWDDESAENILAIINRAMNKKAKILVVESLLPDWPATSIASLWDFHMLVNTGGRERNIKELKQIAKKAGLRPVSVKLLDGLFSLVIFESRG
ncbi:MAG: ubiquinone/menaquinone biosynthesis protein [Desulfotalea sp.]|nr:MAG: ubiquinone/menaquinone biosynthesis protein [Desulfotalea sp.]